jgi:hypothetical protein
MGCNSFGVSFSVMDDLSKKSIKNGVLGLDLPGHLNDKHRRYGLLNAGEHANGVIISRLFFHF